MREKNYNTGLRGVLFEAQHYERMGSAIWLYGWLVLRQTHQTGTVGWVLGGAPITYREIEEETGFNRRTLERWMRILRVKAYIETTAVPGGVSVRILKAKKHLGAAVSTETARKVAEAVRRIAGRTPQPCVANVPQVPASNRDAGRIRSSSVVRQIEKHKQNKTHSAVEILDTRISPTTPLSQEISECERIAFRQQFQKLLQKNNFQTSCLRQVQNAPANQNSSRSNLPPEDQKYKPRQAENPAGQQPTQHNFQWELRARMRLIRAEREEAVRRELAVGTGPEVPRP
jgi:CTP-dependent riboflavin kinase